jgi:formate C-acetyltransferase
MKRGLSLEDARNYSPIGCVEPAETETTGPPAAAPEAVIYHLPNACSGNQRRQPYHVHVCKAGEKAPRVGLPTGYLYEMETLTTFLRAYRIRLTILSSACYVNNNAEYVTRELLPLPVVSATMAVA